MTEKNFETLEENCWYQIRNGSIVQARSHPGSKFSMNGLIYNCLGDCVGFNEEFDVIQKIEPPVIVPVKRKVKVTKYLNIYPGADCEIFSSCTIARHTAATRQTVATIPVTFEAESE